LLVLSCNSTQALVAEHFQPLKDTLAQYGISKLPEPADYPDVPAVAILSVTEYHQNGSKHTRTYHKIVKILTRQGKDYANIRIPCVSNCHIEARTIKSNGTIVNLPSRDLFQTRNLSGYQSTFFYAQFAMPDVESGDIIEYSASIEFPTPFLLEDFRFQEPYPILTGVFVLTHPSDDSYSYIRYWPAGTPPIQVTQNQFMNGPVKYSSTTFIVNNVKEGSPVPYSPTLRQDLPGIRLMIEARSGRPFEVFKDWSRYGEFVLQQAGSPGFSNEVVNFAKNAAGNSEDVQEIIRKIYAQADREIEITDDSLLASGFEFRRPDEVLRQKVAAPHDFALFLAACFRWKHWSADLVLVNSHQRADASKDSVFPPDLDLVFLNVKTPVKEFLLDCNQNGLPAFALSSASMNRFALGLPLFVVTTQFTHPQIYTFVVPYREGNVSRMEIQAVPEEVHWKLDFHWTLSGEFQAPWAQLLRKKGEAVLKNKLMQELRSRSAASGFDNLSYAFTSTGFEVRVQAYRNRIPVAKDMEMLQNDLWNSGFDLRPLYLEQRLNRFLLPSAGEVSAVIQVRLPGTRTILPSPVTATCLPGSYSVTFRQEKQQLTIEEKLVMRDMEIRPESFPKFTDFLNQYYKNHFWSVLLAS
jgi:hypothetical protein